MAFTPIDEEEIIDEPVAEEVKPRFVPIEDDEFFGIGGEEEPEQVTTPEVIEPTEAPKSRFTPISDEEFFGIEAPTDPIPVTGEEGFLRQAADVPLKIGESINTSLRALTDLFGADNAVSQNLTQNADWYRSLLSAQAMEDEQEIGRILQEAEDAGVTDQLAAGLEAFSVAPVDFVASGLGSLAVFAAGGIAGRAVGLGAKGVQAVQAGLGAGMGAGIAKGEIYQSVKDEMLSQGKTEEEARQVATEAQSFGGKNLDQILIGAGLGTIDAFTGAEKIIGKVLTKGGLAPNASRVGNILKNGITEGAPEFIQAAQEKFASNLALKREGVDISLTQGIFSQGALEGLVGVGLGAGAGAIEPRTQPATKEESLAAASETQDVARQNKDVAPETAALVEGQAESVIQENAETPEQRVARLQEEATAAAGIELEEEGVGVEPTVPVTPPVEPAPEGAVAPVEPVVEPLVAESQPVAEVAPEVVQQAEQRATTDFAEDLYGNEPYINHLRRVAEQMPNNKLKSVAFLHDSVEDGKISLDDVSVQFGEDVSGLVDTLTRKDEETYAQYIDRVAQNPEATQVKLADLRENIRNVEDFKPSLRSRYEKAIAKLEAAQPVAQVPPELEPLVPQPEKPQANEGDIEALRRQTAEAKEAVVDEATFNQYETLRKQLDDSEFQQRYGATRMGRQELETILAPLEELNKDLPDVGRWTKGEKIRDTELGGEFKPAGNTEGALFRGVTNEDWARIQKQGFIDTDGRGVITPDLEQVNLSKNSTTAVEYIPSGQSGVVLQIDPSGLDLFMVGSDDYVRARNQIPLSAIKQVSQEFRKGENNELLKPLEPTPEAVTPTPENPNIEPLRRVARAEQATEDIPSLVDAGLVEVYKDQPVLTEAGIAQLPEAERPRLNPEARKIQIDTGSNEVVAEAIAKGLRIGVDQVGTGVRMPAGWTLVEDIYVPPAPIERIAPSDIETAVIPEEAGDVFANLVRRKQEVQPVVLQKPVGSQFQNPEEFRSAFDLRGQGHTRFAIRLDLMQEDGAITEDGKNLILATIWDNNTNDEFLANMEMGSARKNVKSYGYGGRTRQTVEGGRVEQKPLLELIRQTRRGGAEADKRTALTLNTFWHEYGHAGYYSLLDAKQKKAVDDAYNKTTRAGRRAFFAEGKSDAENTPWFSKYYAKNESEWFAQSFAEYVITQKSDQKNLVPVFEQILDKIKAVFTKLFNRKEQVNLNDIFDFIIRGEAYGQKPTWQGYTMSTKPAVYGTPRGQAISPEFTKRALERERGASFADERRQQIIDGISLKFKRSKNEYGNNNFKTEYDFGGRSEVVDKISFSLEQFDDGTVAIDYLASKGGKYANIKLGELEQEFKGRAAAERAIKRAIAEIEMDERVGGAEEATPITDVWQAPEQEITSAKTSINEKKLPAVFSKVKEWVSGTINADIGGGRFDNATNWLRDRGVTNLIIDWFNRDRAFNEANIDRVRGGQADTATASNVLNVIQEPEARDLVIRQAADAIKEDGTAYFYIYEGDKSGTGKQTTSGWQENRRTQDYIDEISQHFGDVTRQGQMIVARNPIKEGAEPTMAPEIPETIPTFSEGSPEASTLSTMAASMAKVDAASEAKGPTIYKISEIASIWMDQGGDTRQLQDLISENTNLTPANAKKVANAIAKQYGLQQQIAETGAVIAEPAPEVEGAPRKTSVQRFIEQARGIRKPIVKLEVSERAELKRQIQLKAREARETRKARKEAAKEVAAFITQYVKDNEIRGPIKSRQSMALAKQALKLDVNNEKAVDKFTMYVERVIENANYDADLRQAKALVKKANKLSKSKTIQANQSTILEAISNVNPSLIDNPFEFNIMVERYLLAFAPVTGERYSVFPDSELLQQLGVFESEAKINQDELNRAAAQRLLEAQAAYADQQGISLDEAQELLNKENNIEEDIKALELEKRTSMENLLTDLSVGIQKELNGYDDSANTPAQKELISFLKKVNVENLLADEKKRYIRFSNNLLANGVTYGLEQFKSIALAQDAAIRGAKDERLSKKFSAWITPFTKKAGAQAYDTAREAARKFASITQSEADTIKNIFGRQATGVVKNLLGLTDLSLAQTAANKADEQIANEVDEFYKGHTKKYGNAGVSEETNAYAAIAAYLIQRSGDKTQEDSVAYRRRLLDENIAELNNGERVQQTSEAELKQKIVNDLTGATNAEILNRLKEVNPAAYDQLIWWKDTMLPKWVDFLKAHDENFRNQANNYNTPDFLSIKYMFDDYVKLPTEYEAAGFDDPVSLRVKQAANSIKRKDHPSLPEREGVKANISIKFGKDQYNALTDQVNRAYTAPAWERVYAFTRTPEFEPIMGGRENAKFVKNMLAKIRTAQQGYGGTDIEERMMAGGVAMVRRLASQRALGGFTQMIRQTVPQLVLLAGTSTRWNLALQNMVRFHEGRELMDKFPIGQRANVQGGAKFATQYDELSRRIEASVTNRNWARFRELMKKMGELWMIPLRTSDTWVASVSWMTYYEDELNKRGIQITDWKEEARLVETDNIRKDAAGYAEQQVDQYQGSSDPTKLASLSRQSNSGWREFGRLIVMPLNSFALQEKSRLVSDVRDLFLRSGDRKDAAKGLAGTLGGMLTFHLIAIYLLGAFAMPLGKTMLAGLFGVDLDEPDEEEKEKQLQEKYQQIKTRMFSGVVTGGLGQVVDETGVLAFNRLSYVMDSVIRPDTILNDKGEVVSFRQYEKEFAPLYRYSSFKGNNYSFGLADILSEQAERVMSESGKLLDEDEMSSYTQNEQAFATVATMVEAMYFAGLMDADVTRMIRAGRRQLEQQKKEEETELARIRAGR